MLCGNLFPVYMSPLPTGAGTDEHLLLSLSKHLYTPFLGPAGILVVTSETKRPLIPLFNGKLSAMA